MIRTKMLLVLSGLLLVRAEAQTVLFDFENANRYSSLPLSLTVGGITAQFTATGQGFSIQAANTMGFTPLALRATAFIPTASTPRTSSCNSPCH